MADDQESRARKKDADLLLRLSGIHAALSRSEQSEAGPRANLRQQQIDALHFETVLRSDELALASLKTGGGSEQAAVAVLETALAGAIEAHGSARRRLDRSNGTTAPLLEHFAQTIKSLEREANAARKELSSEGLRHYGALLRLKRLPFVAYVRGGLCGECHLRLPSALASSVSTGATDHRCPFCIRLLLPDAPAPSSLR
jgi:hypothetical protein